VNAGGLEVADALDDLARRSQEIRLLEVLEGPVRTHHALENRPLAAQRFRAVGGIDQVEKVEVTETQRARIAPERRAVLADRLGVVLDHLLATGGAGEPAVGAGDPREHGRHDVRHVG